MSSWAGSIENGHFVFWEEPLTRRRCITQAQRQSAVPRKSPISAYIACSPFFEHLLPQSCHSSKQPTCIQNSHIYRCVCIHPPEYDLGQKLRTGFFIAPCLSKERQTSRQQDMAIPSSEAHLHKYVMGMRVMLEVDHANQPHSAPQNHPEYLFVYWGYIGVTKG